MGEVTNDTAPPRPCLVTGITSKSDWGKGRVARDSVVGLSGERASDRAHARLSERELVVRQEAHDNLIERPASIGKCSLHGKAELLA